MAHLPAKLGIRANHLGYAIIRTLVNAKQKSRNFNPIFGRNMQKIGIVDKVRLPLTLLRMPVEPHILKAARFMLSLSQEDIAKEAKLSIRTIYKLEAGGRGLSLASLEAVRRALEARGVIFLGSSETLGPGFRVTHAVLESWQYVPPKSDPSD